MSTVSRVVSGSVASWSGIGVMLLTQVVLVPLYLTYWNLETYGVWLAIQALISVLTSVDFGHQEFLGFEFLRVGKDNRAEISRFLSAGLLVSVALNVGQLALIGGIITAGWLPRLLEKAAGIGTQTLHEAGLALLLLGVAWFIGTSLPGLIARALAPYGYYPRMAWWGLLSTIVSAVVPIVAVCCGAKLLVTALVLTSALVVGSIPQYLDMFRLLRREGFALELPSVALGGKNFMHSLAVSGKGLLENARLQGVRLLLAPLAGVASLAAFSTMRTGANVALQGLNSITSPMLPDFMRFLHERDQARSEAAFGMVWILVVSVMAPAIVLLQACIEPLYLLWTRGRLVFDPVLFALLSIGVLVHALAQPAISIVRGNNLLRPQLLLSALAAVVVVGGLYVLVPRTGILGAGIALLAAELVATAGYRLVAQRWLHQHHLAWPRQAASVAAASIWIAAAGMAAMLWLPQLKWLALPSTLLLLGWNSWRYWQALPAFATDQARKFAIRLPGLKRLLVN